VSEFDADAMRRYEETRDAVGERLRRLESLLEPAGAARVEAARARLERGKFVLAVIGEFSSGKSFLLNALLGTFRHEGAARRLVGLLATDINPSTAAITEIEYGAENAASAIYEDGRTERIPLDALNRFIAVGGDDAGGMHRATDDATLDSGGGAAAPARVLVRAASPFLERGFVLADTPGLASINPAHRRATLNFLPSADAVLYLIDTQQPFTEGDAAFLSIVRKHIDSIFIVQTKIDLWRQPQPDGRSAWQSAHERIAQRAAVHAPGTYVHALSARDYAEGTLAGDRDLIDASRFPLFLASLDASLISRTGRARLRRAGDAAASAADDAIAQIDSDRAMLAIEAQRLLDLRAAALPELDAIEARARSERGEVLTSRDAQLARADERGETLAAEMETALAQAFDTADIARLRDRARLHALIDREIAQLVGDFAARVAAESVDDLQKAAQRARDIPGVRFSLNDAAARAFGAEPGTSLWNGDARGAIASSIVLDAVGGIAVTLAHDIASRFAANAAASYMKRELIADLRSDIFPRLRRDAVAFARGAVERSTGAYAAFADALAEGVSAARAGRLGSIDRALAARERGDADAADRELERRRAQVRETADAVAAGVDAFLAHEDEIAPADPGDRAVRAAHVEPALDAVLYDKGLRPERWRVAVLGALRRGKSGIINAFAGKDVLADTVAGSATFPIHVRYGDADQSFALSETGAWNEVPVETTIEHAAQSPVLRLTPWAHPRELVLVHAPAFDSGEPSAEDVSLVVAQASSAVICLFSRQLSDRELSLYERVAELGKPMLFAHTIADNETASERRNVVDLARTYLKERGIAAARVFTVSAQEFAQAAAAGRAPAAWNELGALIATVEGATESHMARLARLARGSAEAARIPTPEEGSKKEGFFARFFGRVRSR
jgi:predicted GTPase